ncbi:MAG: serine acetyltransferase [Burkholderiales bacterium PBB2]|nr:MAG: serine acetyltransferase [Burkholderiales bacterium PBB2]
MEDSGFPDPLAALKADTFRQYGYFSWLALFKGVMLARTFRPLVTMRICQYFSNSGRFFRLALPFFKVLHRLATHSAAVDLSWQTKIGGGLALTHGWGMVVSPGAVIGRNVTIFHGATLGRGDRIARDGSRQSGYPSVEDEVWIGLNSIIVGAVVIGLGSRVCGGAYVTEDVPPYSVVAGNSGCVVKLNCTPDVMNRVEF